MAGAAHPGSEPTLVDTPTGRLADERTHPWGAQRVLRIQPLVEQPRDLERQPQQNVGGVAGARGARGAKDRFNLVIGEPGNDRSDEDGDRDAAAAQALDRRKALAGARSARLHAPRELVVQGRHRDRDIDQRLARHDGEKIRVAFDQH